MNTLAFFNNKGGVGKTTLVYHLTWMLAELGLSVVAADLDPQANLSSMFLDEDRLEAIWSEPGRPRTVSGSLGPLMEGTGDVAEPWIAGISPGIGLVVGDLALSTVEDEMSSQWPGCLDGKSRAFRVITAFWRLLAKAARKRDADVVLIDVAPSLGALNRAALIAATHVVIPLVPDLYSIQGLENLGPTLRDWRKGWRQRLEKLPGSLKAEPMPGGAMHPVGYVVLQHAVRLDRPVKAYQRWLDRVPAVYRHSVLDQAEDHAPDLPADDPNCLAQLKHYRSLMPMAQEVRKPMFLLTPADGALGGHFRAAQACRDHFRILASELAHRCGLPLP